MKLRFPKPNRLERDTDWVNSFRILNRDRSINLHRTSEARAKFISQHLKPVRKRRGEVFYRKITSTCFGIAVAYSKEKPGYISPAYEGEAIRFSLVSKIYRIKPKNAAQLIRWGALEGTEDAVTIDSLNAYQHRQDFWKMWSRKD